MAACMRRLVAGFPSLHPLASILPTVASVDRRPPAFSCTASHGQVRLTRRSKENDHTRIRAEAYFIRSKKGEDARLGWRASMRTTECDVHLFTQEPRTSVRNRSSIPSSDRAAPRALLWRARRCHPSTTCCDPFPPRRDPLQG